MILRRATAADAAAVAAVSTGSRHAAMPRVRWAHTAEDDANNLVWQRKGNKGPSAGWARTAWDSYHGSLIAPHGIQS